MVKRERVLFDDGIMEMLLKMAEGNMGAANVLHELLANDEMALLDILSLDDMNIRGAQIWFAYKDYCGCDIKLFQKLIKKRDDRMIEAVNIQSAKGGVEFKAMRSGASAMTQDKLVFTSEELKKYQEATPIKYESPTGGQMGE